MNEAHLHMLVNHFPIIGTIFGLGIMLGGFLYKNVSVKNTAYVLFITSAIFAFLSVRTGEGAEEIVEDMPAIGHKIIHEHEEIAEKFALVLYLLGITSVLGLYTNIRNHAKAKLVSYIVIILAVIGISLSVLVGNTGGEIRHTEIRSESNKTNPSDLMNNLESEEHED